MLSSRSRAAASEKTLVPSAARTLDDRRSKGLDDLGQCRLPRLHESARHVIGVEDADAKATQLGGALGFPGPDASGDSKADHHEKGRRGVTSSDALQLVGWQPDGQGL